MIHNESFDFVKQEFEDADSLIFKSQVEKTEFWRRFLKEPMFASDVSAQQILQHWESTLTPDLEGISAPSGFDLKFIGSLDWDEIKSQKKCAQCRRK